MSNVPIKDSEDATRRIDVISRTEGSDTVETQAVTVVDPTNGTPIEFATQTTVTALLTAANAIKVAAEALNSKATTINTGAIAGTVALDSETLAALESPTVGGTVSVSNMVAAGLTDAQLRAAAVPVSGTFWQETQPVSGPLTAAQLRESDVPVSVASLPLPAGAATDATLTAVQTLIAILAGTIQAHYFPLDGEVLAMPNAGKSERYPLGGFVQTYPG